MLCKILLDYSENNSVKDDLHTKSVTFIMIIR